MKSKIDKNGNAEFNPNDQTIWYNNIELRKKVEKIKKKFGAPFLIAKDGTMLYEDCVVIPAFRGSDKNE